MPDKGKKKGLLRSIFSFPDFSGKEPIFISDDSLIGGVDKSHYRFLDRYSLDEMNLILDRAGLFSDLRRKGFPDIKIEISRDMENIHYLKIYTGKINPDKLLIDLRLSEGRFSPNNTTIKLKNVSYDIFRIEWLQLQNPNVTEFSQDRPQLPGQKRPGLGSLRYLIRMMNLVSYDLTRDGFLDIPDHFHLGVMYSGSFHFFDPKKEGEMLSLFRDLGEYSLYDLTWGVMTSAITDKKTGKPFIYTPSEEIFPVSDRMKSYFQSNEYIKIVKDIRKKRSYEFDTGIMNRKRTEILKTKDISEL